MFSTGTWIFRSSGLRTPASTTSQSRPAPDQEAANLLERALRGRQADALERPARQVLEPLEGEGEVRAALGARHGVDLVHDHRLGVHEELARPRCEHQVERLRRGDEHVGRVAEHRLALLLRRVAGADGHRHVPADPLERGAEVLLDVVGESLQRRDVDQARAARARRALPPAGRAPRGTRRASCPSRWAPTRARCGPRRSRARPSPARRWDARRSA